jgi:hypothetical protein
MSKRLSAPKISARVLSTRFQLPALGLPGALEDDVDEPFSRKDPFVVGHMTSQMAFGGQG